MAYRKKTRGRNMFFSKKALPIRYSYRQRIVFVHDISSYANRYAADGWELFSVELLNSFNPSELFWQQYSNDFPNRHLLEPSPYEETEDQPEHIVEWGKGIHRVMSERTGTSEAVLLVMRKVELEF